MGSDQERTADTVGSDRVEIGPEGDAAEPASDAAADTASAEAPDTVQGAVAGAASGDANTTQEAAPAKAEVEGKKKKKGKKKDSGLGSSRGIETMFRTSYRVHQDLVGLADTKANIMISVNGLIISIILAAVSPRIGGLPLLVLPTSILLVGCVVALVYAVLAARPRVSNTPMTLEDIARNDANILFFGNFVNLSEAEFVEGMRDLMMTQDHLYVNMVRDLYGLGQVLKTKFRLLRISYNVFMVALVLGVALYVLGFLDVSIASNLAEPQGTLPVLQ
ncbi:MAG: hypothetical protein IH921_09745 [Gemmatimonadetes bacterium]|nr:hypothetical protein [Gemmatimonadota bacterium]